VIQVVRCLAAGKRPTSMTLTDEELKRTEQEERLRAEPRVRAGRKTRSTIEKQKGSKQARVLGWLGFLALLILIGWVASNPQRASHSLPSHEEEFVLGCCQHFDDAGNPDSCANTSKQACTSPRQFHGPPDVCLDSSACRTRADVGPGGGPADLAASLSATPVSADELEDTLIRLGRESAHPSIEFKTEKVAGAFRLNVWFPANWGGDNATDTIVYDTREIAEYVLKSHSWSQVIVFRGYSKNPPWRIGNVELFQQLVVQYTFDPARETLTLDHVRRTSFSADEFSPQQPGLKVWK